MRHFPHRKFQVKAVLRQNKVLFAPEARGEPGVGEQERSELGAKKILFLHRKWPQVELDAAEPREGTADARG